MTIDSSCCDSLQFDASYDILKAYRLQRKDGYNACDGKAYDARGGSRSSTDACRDGETPLARKEATGLQGFWTVAYQSLRAKDISRRAKEEAGKLITVLSVAELTPIVYQAVSASSCTLPCCFIVPYSSARCKRKDMAV